MCPLCHDEGHALSRCPRWRNVRSFAAILCMSGSTCIAAPVAVIDSELGHVTLDGERTGHCQAPARGAVWRSPDGQTTVPGCWIVIAGGVQIAFADGDVLRVPMRALRPPSGA
jgi:hypothetical protein